MGTLRTPGDHDVDLPKLAPDEPFFILRAQDGFAPLVVDTWICMAVAHGVSPVKIAEARALLQSMIDWQGQKKIPD